MNIISNLLKHIFFVNKMEKLNFFFSKDHRNNTIQTYGKWFPVKLKKMKQHINAALREIKEETGLTPEKFWVAPTVNSFYSPDKDYICLLPVFAAKVKSDSEVTISKEHDEYKWLNPEEAKQLLAWDGQRKSVDVIVDYFLNRNSFLNFIEIKL